MQNVQVIDPLRTLNFSGVTVTFLDPKYDSFDALSMYAAYLIDRNHILIVQNSEPPNYEFTYEIYGSLNSLKQIVVDALHDEISPIFDGLQAISFHDIDDLINNTVGEIGNRSMFLIK